LTMTTNPRARVAPAATAAELTEQINVLVDEDMRAFLIGSKLTDNARSEAAVARSLMATAIKNHRRADPIGYADRIELGRRALAARKQVD
jgi:hypothetical protein